ncbi:hypothetical protein N7462_010697 [Penicillium macrosclerotiorum]|uniref:uncharacterized protein n=1 Tax=Penicillium macrosclerotiorum TaxID=303699 RepID=UPI002549274E|nr:uncharacterized protein N7462_010697 [Penicillium macrosclerotiorum]KAJ5669627.1 hypothetical protein N7462_010697 [Penicillium macrosclerotiorum]
MVAVLKESDPFRSGKYWIIVQNRTQLVEGEGMLLKQSHRPLASATNIGYDEVATRGIDINGIQTDREKKQARLKELWSRIVDPQDSENGRRGMPGIPNTRVLDLQDGRGRSINSHIGRSHAKQGRTSNTWPPDGEQTL